MLHGNSALWQKLEKNQSFYPEIRQIASSSFIMHQHTMMEGKSFIDSQGGYNLVLTIKIHFFPLLILNYPVIQSNLLKLEFIALKKN